MTDQTISINGVEVRTNLEVSSIANGRIEFRGGSWCNVDTGQIVNRGNGYIQFSQPSAVSNVLVTCPPQSFPAAALAIKGLEADIAVEPHDEPGITVLREGCQSDVDSIQVKHEGETLVLSSSRPSGGRVRVESLHITPSESPKRSGPRLNCWQRFLNWFWSIGSVQLEITSIQIGGHVISSNQTSGGAASVVVGHSRTSCPKVTIRVPKGMPITLENVRGTIRMGEIGGPLSILSSGTADIHVEGGDANGLTVVSKSIGRVRFGGEVQGKVHLACSGSGGITVDRGHSSGLTVVSESIGGVVFGGSVAGNVDLTCTGSGGITVKDGVARVLTVVSKSIGRVRFGGRAESADLLCSGSGDVYVKHADRVTRRDRKSIGRITVGNM